MNGDARYWKLVEPVWETISIYDGPVAYLEGMHTVPEHVGLLFAAHWAYSEMGNGGFSQFFMNDTGVVAPEALRGFRALGLAQSAEILERAIGHFGRIYPRDRDERIALMDISMEPSCYMHDRSFDGLDRELWPLIEEEAGGFEDAASRYAGTFPDGPER